LLLQSQPPYQCIRNPSTHPKPPIHPKPPKVYDASEAVFARLADECRKLRDWAALAWAERAGGREGLEVLVEARCGEVEEFESNLKGLKVWREVFAVGRAFVWGSSMENQCLISL